MGEWDTWLFSGVEIRLNERHQVRDVLAEERAADLLDLEIAGHGRHEEEPGRPVRAGVRNRPEHRVVARPRPDESFQNVAFVSLLVSRLEKLFSSSVNNQQNKARLGFLFLVLVPGELFSQGPML